jgi:hypothetical protein
MHSQNDTPNDLPRRASLEALVESGDLGFQILHPGGLELTRELAELCHLGTGKSVLITDLRLLFDRCEISTPQSSTPGKESRTGRSRNRRRMDVYAKPLPFVFENPITAGG